MIRKCLKELNINYDKLGLFYQSTYYVICEDNKYLIRVMNKNDIELYNILIAINANISRYINKISVDGKEYYLFLLKDFIGEEKAVSNNLFKEAIKIFQKTEFDRVLKKEDVNRLNSIYKILDSRFLYLELRIREIETTVYQTDYNWIVLSKYHIILDLKEKLFSLQERILKEIDKSINVKFGLVIKNLNACFYIRNELYEYFGSKIAPISSLLARFYVSNSHLNLSKDIFDKYLTDKFLKMHFTFEVCYIFMLKISLPKVLNMSNINSYLGVIRQITFFTKEFRDYI